MSEDEHIACRRGCISVDATRAKQAKRKDLLMFIGNTGPGKSTMVKFLHGFEMEDPNQIWLSCNVPYR